MGEKLDAGEVYVGPAGALRDSNWLTHESLPPDRDTLVQIEAVVRRRIVKFKNEEKRGYGSLKFVGKEKELGLNSTHLHVLCALFGTNTGDWKGRWIALYVDPEVQAFGRTVSAVRIRPRKVEPPKGGAKAEESREAGAEG